MPFSFQAFSLAGIIELAVRSLARQEPSCGDEYKHDCYDHNNDRNLAVLWCLLRVKHYKPPFVMACIIRLTNLPETGRCPRVTYAKALDDFFAW